MPVEYRANFGDGTWTRPYLDVRDARREIWGRAAIVQYRSFVEATDSKGDWYILIASRASRNGPPITEQRESRADQH